MVMNFLGGGVVINVLVIHVGADIVVIDVGVVVDLLFYPFFFLVKIG